MFKEASFFLHFFGLLRRALFFHFHFIASKEHMFILFAGLNGGSKKRDCIIACLVTFRCVYAIKMSFLLSGAGTNLKNPTE
jgi:hypothetical protein